MYLVNVLPEHPRFGGYPEAVIQKQRVNYEVD